MSNKEDHVNKGGLMAFTFSMIFTFAFFAYVIAKGVKDDTNIINEGKTESSSQEK